MSKNKMKERRPSFVMMKLQTKITVKYHSTSNRVAKKEKKKTDNTKSWLRLGVSGILVNSCQECKMVQ